MAKKKKNPKMSYLTEYIYIALSDLVFFLILQYKLCNPHSSLNREKNINVNNKISVLHAIENT